MFSHVILTTIMKRSPSLYFLLLGLLVGSVACGPQDNAANAPASSSVPEIGASVPADQVRATPAATETAETSEAAETEPAATAPDYFQQAIDRATSAVNISQNARSQDDWGLVASRWRQAIALLQAVPSSSANYAQAQAKITEYQSNLTYAEQQASQTIASSGGTSVIRPTSPASSSITRRSESSVSEPSDTSSFRAPIIGRAGGTPIVSVNFNGGQSFPMILDTGASGTVITPAMASSLGVEPVGETSVSTASARNVTFDLGYVDSMELGGIVIQDVLVAVSNPELELGLLGNDFFGNYDVTIREDHVEFNPR